MLSGVGSVLAYHRALSTVPGDPTVRGLPVNLYRKEIAEQLMRHSRVGIRAPPGSGKNAVFAKHAP